MAKPPKKPKLTDGQGGHSTIGSVKPQRVRGHMATPPKKKAAVTGAHSPKPPGTSQDRTEVALANLTDSSLFERIVNAVIRIDRKEMSGFVQLGVNAAGKTRKAPVDGLTFSSGGSPPRLTVVQHTTARLKDLRGKWLHDPATVTPKRNGQPTQPPGDALKAVELVTEERLRTPDLEAKLLLTTNEEPDQELIREIAAYGRAEALDIEILARSSIAHVLDHTPEGQSVRRQLLGIDQELLSWDLLRELGEATVRNGGPADDHALRVRTRTLDDLADVLGPVTLLVGASGSGKSVAAHEWLRAGLSDESVACIVLRDSVLQATATLDSAIEAELRAHMPSLLPGSSALDLCTDGKRLRIVVEDVVLSSERSRILEKLTKWSGGKQDGDDPTIVADTSWTLICPVQQWVLDAMPIPWTGPHRLHVQALTDAEAAEAFILRAGRFERRPTYAEAVTAADALGRDPLLIALHDPEAPADLASVLGTYVSRKLDEFAPGGGIRRSRAERAMQKLAREMVRRRSPEPTFRQMEDWFEADPDAQVMWDLLEHGSPARIERLPGRDELRFRHDRVRDWILSECIRRDIDNGESDPVVAAEPFNAALLGKAAARTVDPVRSALWLLDVNPLAAFHAYAHARTRPYQAAIAASISDWLGDSRNLGPGTQTLAFMAQSVLAEVEAPDVLPMLELFRDQSPATDIGRFRNGDLGGGLRICASYGIVVDYPYRDHLVAHVVERYGDAFDRTLSELIRDPEVKGHNLSSALDLAGFSGRQGIGSAIADRWEADGERDRALVHYVWALARCLGSDEVSAALDTALHVWQQLNRNADEIIRMEMDELRLGFALHPPLRALDHLLQQAGQGNARNLLAWTLGEIDDPRAVAFKIAFEGEATGLRILNVNGIANHWRRRGDKGVRLSSASRDAAAAIWSDTDANEATRRIALETWAVGASLKDLETLASLDGDAALGSTALRMRMALADRTAVPALIERLRHESHPFDWAFLAYQIADDRLLRELPGLLARHIPSGSEENAWGWAKLAADQLTRRSSQLARSIMIETWPIAGHLGPYVWGALFLGGDELEALAAASVRAAPDPATMFKFGTMFLRGGINGHPGATHEDQIDRIVPYQRFLDETSLNLLRNLCDAKGWRTSAERLPEGRRTRCWNEANIREQLEDLAQVEYGYWSIRALEDALEGGLSRATFMRELTAWLASTPTMNAFAVANEIVRQVGTRSELEVLNASTIAVTADGQTLIKDTAFAVKCRTPYD